MFDYLLDDAAVYAVFNHQIADLPNPQSPYKKDNPKTWGDSVLIDFGDGTSGIAKKITIDKTKTSDSPQITVLGGQINGIIDWGCQYVLGKNNYTFAGPDFSFNTGNTILRAFPDYRYQLSCNLQWSNGLPGEGRSCPESVWVWVLFDNSYNENVDG